jgi:dephospho-CoA kinase
MATSPRVIALCGLKRCGKDTVADVLVREYGFEHRKIAEKLKSMVQNLFDLSLEQVESDLKETVDPRWGVSPRRLMQFFGTEVLQEKIQELMPHKGRRFLIQSTLAVPVTCPMVISDLRFMHEYEVLREAFPNSLEVIEVRRQTLASASPDTHISEHEFVRIPKNKILYNNGTVADLQSHARRLCGS